MIADDVFRDQPVLTGPRVRLEPLDSRHFDGLWPMFGEPEGSRLTGTHATFSEEQIRGWLATRQDHHDRADWAIVRIADDAVLGEAVVNDLDPANAAANYRIALVGPEVFGQGYGTEATRLVVDYVLDVAGLHRLHLEVYAFNPRAERTYEKCGFVREGVRRDALHWEGEWHDAISMAILATDPRPAAAPAPPAWTKTNFGALRDVSPPEVPMQWRFARNALQSPELGVSRFTYEPGARMPRGHRHRVQEEVYVVVAGSGRARLDDDVLELSSWDVLRVAPQVIRSFEAGPDGLDVICIGGRKPEGGDTERFEDFRP